MIKNVSVKLFSFITGESIGDQKVSAKFYSFFNGGSIGDEERVCQTLQVHQWRQYWWSRTCLSNIFSFINGGSIGDEERVCQTLQFLQWRQYCWSRRCLSNSSVSSMEGVLVIKNVSVKLFFLQLSSMEGVLMIKNVSLKLVSFINGVGIGDEERACQTLLLI